MKMIVAIVQDGDKDNISRALNEASYRVTVLPSSGAYFRRGNATLIIGVEDDQVRNAIDVVRAASAEPGEPGLKRATVFVLDVDRFEQV